MTGSRALINLSWTICSSHHACKLYECRSSAYGFFFFLQYFDCFHKKILSVNEVSTHVKPWNPTLHMMIHIIVFLTSDNLCNIFNVHLNGNFFVLKWDSIGRLMLQKIFFK